MTYRIHTADASWVHIQFDTVANVDEQLGYEHTEDEAQDQVMILNDMGNQEAWVLTGTEDEWRGLAQRILRRLDQPQEPYDPHGGEKHRYYEEN